MRVYASDDGALGVRYSPVRALPRETVELPATIEPVPNLILGIEMYGDDTRHDFPVTGSWIYLAHATGAPIPLSAQQALSSWAEGLATNGPDPNENWGLRADKQFQAGVSKLIDADAGTVAFVASATAGLSWILDAYPWTSGDSLTLASRVSATLRATLDRLREVGVEIREPSLPLHLPELVSSVDSSTRLVLTDFVDLYSGCRSKLMAIGEFCRSRSVDFGVEATQGLGVLPLFVNEMHIDFLAAEADRWLLGPPGTAILYSTGTLLDKLKPVVCGWGVHDQFSQGVDVSDTARGRFTWSNIPGILALNASLEVILKAGVDNVSEKIKANTDLLVDRLTTDTDAHLHSRRSKGEWSGIVAVDFFGRDAEELQQYCRDRMIIISRCDDRLLISPHFYNTEEEIERLVMFLCPH